MLSFIVKRVAAAPLALAFALSSTPAVSAPHAEDNYSTGRFLASFEIENCIVFPLSFIISQKVLWWGLI